MKYFNSLSGLFLLAGVVFFPACNSNTAKTVNSKATVIHLQPEKQNKIRFSNYFSDVKIVTLKTDTTHMIGRITKAAVGNNGKNLLIRSRTSLFVFDNKGNFKFQLKRGKGPGEFSSITSSRIGIPNSLFSFIDFYKQKLYIYNFDGKQKEKIDLNIFVEAASPLNKNIYALYVNMPNSRTKFKLNFLDIRSGKFIKKYFPLNEKYTRFLNLHSNNFFYNGNKIYFINTPFDTVYDISHFQEMPKPVYILNTGKHKLRTEDLNHNFNNIVEFVNYTKKNNLAFYFNHFNQVNPFLFFSYSYAGKFYPAIYNLHTKKALNVRNFTDDVIIKNHSVKMFNFFYPVGQTKNALIFAADPLQIKQQMDSLSQNLPIAQWTRLQKENPDLFHLYKNITLKTNPVLLFYRVK